MTLEIIISAIEQKKSISFNYDNQERTVQPHHLGIYGDNLQIHSYQDSIGFFSGGWRNFIFDKMHNVSINESYFSPKNSYNPQNCKYKVIYYSVDESYNNDPPENLDNFKP